MDESHIETGRFSECVQTQVNALLDRIPNLQAIVCANDVMALTAYQECEKRGLHIGHDIAVTGFDDWERIRHVPVPITQFVRILNGQDIWLFIVHLSWREAVKGKIL